MHVPLPPHAPWLAALLEGRTWAPRASRTAGSLQRRCQRPLTRTVQWWRGGRRQAHARLHWWAPGTRSSAGAGSARARNTSRRGARPALVGHVGHVPDQDRVLVHQHVVPVAVVVPDLLHAHLRHAGADDVVLLVPLQRLGPAPPGPDALALCAPGLWASAQGPTSSPAAALEPCTGCVVPAMHRMRPRRCRPERTCQGGDRR